MRLLYSLLFFTILMSTNTLSAQICPEFTDNTLSIVTDDCRGAAICTNIDFNSVENYDVELNGNFYSGTTSPCGFNTTVRYDVLGIGNYPVNIISWEVNGIVYQNIICNSPGALTDTMNFINPGGNWMFDDNEFKINSTTSVDSLGWLILEEVNTGLEAEIIPEYNSTPTNTSFEFPVGNNVFIVRDFANDCGDTLFVEVICQPEPDSIALTIEIGDSDTLFLDTSTIPDITDFYDDCITQNGVAVNFELDEQLYTVFYEGTEIGTEQACIVFCNGMGQCDTTYFSVTVEAGVTCVDPEIVFVELTDATCDELGSIALEMSDNSEELNFFWSGGLPNAAEVAGLMPGNYAVTVTYVNPDFAGCSTVGAFLVSQMDSLDFFLQNITNVDCSDLGSAEFSNPNLVYTWSDGSTGHLREDLTVGTYTITVSDANGFCQETTVIEIQETSFTIQASVSNQCDTLGSIYLQNVNGAVFPVTYNWFDLPGTDNDASRPELAPGTYTLEITDDNGCTATEIYTIVDDCPSNCTDPVIASVETIDPDCENLGSIFIEMSDTEPYNFVWSHGGSNGSDQTALSAGIYNVTIAHADSINCFITASFTLQNTDTLDYNLFGTTPAGCTNNGTATFDNLDYTYLWPDGIEGIERDGLAAGNYNVTVTSSNGVCEDITTVNIEGSSILLNAQVANVCDTLGSIYTFATGGNFPYTYEWSDDPFIVSSSREELNVGVYTVTVTDGNGCTLSESFQIVDDCNGSGELNFTFIPNDENIACGTTAPLIQPEAESDCPGEIEMTFTETTAFNCGGTNIITRRWVATDDCGNAAVAEQNITEIDFEAPIIMVVDSLVTVDLLNGDTLPFAQSLVSVSDACGGNVNMTFTKSEDITADGYQVTYTYTATDGCGNQSVNTVTVNIIGGLIWPGDTDSSGVVNNEDLFNIGFAHGLTGPSRINPTIDFLPQYASPWSENGIDEVNFRHADTDGNGVVDEQDILAVNQNYDLTHNLQEQAGDTRESFEVDFELDQITADDWVHVDVLLANGATIEDFYGAAFIIEYDASLVKENTAHLDFSDSWVGSFFTDFVALQKDFYDEGQLDIGLVRIDQQGIDGSGKIASFRFQLQQGVPFSNFILTARVGKGVRADRSEYELENAEVLITSTQEILPVAIIGVYPNPATTELFVEIPQELAVKAIDLFGANGQQVTSFDTTDAHQLDVSQLPAGIYSLRIITDQGVWTNRVSILR